MGLDERLDKIIRTNTFDWKAMKQAIKEAVCEEEEHKWERVKREKTKSGWYRDHYKCVRCGHQDIDRKHRLTRSGTFKFE